MLVRKTFFSILFLSVSAISQAATLDIFISTNQGITIDKSTVQSLQHHGYKIRIRDLSELDKLENELSVPIAKLKSPTEKKAKEKLHKQLNDSRVQALAKALEDTYLAKEHGIKTLPAVLVDKRVVIQPVKNFKRLIHELKKEKK